MVRHLSCYCDACLCSDINAQQQHCISGNEWKVVHLAIDQKKLPRPANSVGHVADTSVEATTSNITETPEAEPEPTSSEQSSQPDIQNTGKLVYIFYWKDLN